MRADCAWCGAPLDAGARRLRGRTVCGACGVATTDPWPTPKELDAAYESWYRPRTGRFSGPGDAILRRSRARLATRIDAQAPPGRVLDVGAGDGTLVGALRAHGRDALGLERGAVDVPHVEARELDEIEGAWAAVVFWHTLEHMTRPTDALAQATRLLVPRGLLVVAVPNAGSLQAKAFGDRWFALDIPRHLVHIPASALTRRLRDTGLDVTRTSHVRGGQIVFGWLHGLVGTLTHIDLYDAIRRPEARQAPLTPARRALALATATVLLPVAALAAAAEVAVRRGGTVAVEARRP